MPWATGMASRTPFTILIALPAVEAASIAFCAQGWLLDSDCLLVSAVPAISLYNIKNGHDEDIIP